MLLRLGLLLCATLWVYGAKLPVPFHQSEDTIQAFSPKGPVTLPVSRFRLDLRLPNGKTQPSDVVVIYDPSSGRWLWLYSNHGDFSRLTNLKSGEEAVYVAPDFAMSVGLASELGIRIFTGRATSMKAALQATLKEIQQRLADIQKFGYPPSPDSESKILWRPLSGDPNPMPRNFNCANDYTSMCSVPVRVSDIARRNDNWRLVFRSAWDQEVILNSNFEFVSTQRLASSPK